LEDASKSIQIRFTFSDGEQIPISVRKGRITNIIIEPDNIEYAKQVSSLSEPFSIYSPGLAGVARSETFVSDGVLLRALARGDANAFLRNILLRLHRTDYWQDFQADLISIFPGASIDVRYDPDIDQFIGVNVSESSGTVPLDLAGTGLLQTIQILSYFHHFRPKIIILDEPDSHLHANNQRLLCGLFETLSEERDTQVLVTTHSRHMVDAMYSMSKIVWVGTDFAKETTFSDNMELLIELGALDVRERLSAGSTKFIVLTEDQKVRQLEKIVSNSGLNDKDFVVWPYNGVTSINLLKPLIAQIRALSQAKLIVHRDRDYLEPDEIAAWQKDIRALSVIPWITLGHDIEDYFCSIEYLTEIHNVVGGPEPKEIMEYVVNDERDKIIEDFYNGRLEIERKRGAGSKINPGKLAAEAAKKADAQPYDMMKGKRKLKKIRKLFKEKLNMSFDQIDVGKLPKDEDLEKSVSSI